jgi:hypothetical protein
MSNITPLHSKAMNFAAPLISPSISEGVLPGPIANDDYVIGGTWLALQCARIAAESCAKVTNSIHADLTASEGAKHAKSDEVTFKIVSNTLPKLDRANQNLTAEIDALKAKTSAPVVDAAGRALAGEIRGILVTMDEKKRRAARATGKTVGKIIVADHKGRRGKRYHHACGGLICAKNSDRLERARA